MSITSEFEASKNLDAVDIFGTFEVNIWYSCLENTKTDVLRETVSYQKDIKTKKIVKSYIDNNVDVLAKVLRHPTVIKAKIDDDKIILDIELEILAEIIGETKIQVTVFNPINNEEEDIEDLDIEVDENFLNSKKE